MSAIQFQSVDTLPEFYKVFKIIEKIGNFYPDFRNWYFDKVIPGVLLNQDEIFIAKKKDIILGACIIKNSDEKKLRCIRVSEEFQNKGYGLYIIDEALKRLNVDKPNLSVPEELMNDYSRIFVNRYQFNLDKVHKNLYRKNKLEYEFNGKTLLKDNINYGI